MGFGVGVEGEDVEGKVEPYRAREERRNSLHRGIALRDIMSLGAEDGFRTPEADALPERGTTGRRVPVIVVPTIHRRRFGEDINVDVQYSQSGVFGMN